VARGQGPSARKASAGLALFAAASTGFLGCGGPIRRYQIPIQMANSEFFAFAIPLNSAFRI
jgi:hypothetical protein